MKKNKIEENLEGLDYVSRLTEHAYHFGSITEEEYRTLKRKIYEKEMDNIFAAMASYCSSN